MSLAARYGLGLLVAVRPESLDALPALLAASAHHGVRITVWPMLDDAHGRWLGVRTVDTFGAFLDEVLARCPAGSIDAVAFDLEPPIGLVSRVLSSTRAASLTPRDARSPGFTVGRDAIASLVARVHDRGLDAVAAAVPMTLFDGPAARWQRALGTPVDGLAWDHVTAMAYSTMFEGWSVRTVERPLALAVVAACARAARERHGARADLSLGAIDTGALGDEPVYRSPAELADDVAVAHACGVDDLTLFDYAGALRRGRPEAWLDAFTAPPRAIEVPTTWRASAVVRSFEAFGGAWPARR